MIMPLADRNVIAPAARLQQNRSIDSRSPMSLGRFHRFVEVCQIQGVRMSLPLDSKPQKFF
ncbi:hypothetical protein QQ045_002472 [Rhodiola kirilowii]